MNAFRSPYFPKRERKLPAVVELETRFGPIEIALDHERAPNSAAHFESLIRDGVLDYASFYRIVHANADSSVGGIDVVQAGVGWDKADKSPTVAHESTLQTGLTNCHGAVSLARSAEADAGSEFFVCIGDQSVLDARGDGTGADGGFAVFGHVVLGMDVVERIHRLPADGDPPGEDERFRGQFLSENVRIESTKVVNEPSASRQRGAL